jgi:hypothetical protein
LITERPCQTYAINERPNEPVSLKRLQLVAEHFGLHITDLLGEPTPASGPEGVEIIRNCAAAVPGVRRGSGVLYELLGSGVAGVIGAATPPW